MMDKMPVPKKEFGVYVHWPFCAAKCPYCDFNSHVSSSPIDEARFAKAYKAEITYWAQSLDQNTPPINSIFFGGGTPSLMSPDLVAQILTTLEEQWGFDSNIEISLEANPQSVDAANFKNLRQAGVNRLSIGVQAFDDRALKALGRLHDKNQARLAIETAQNNFDRFSFDLIYARPHQSLESWADELQQAFSFAPPHLSLYQLTIEPNTPYKKLYDAGKLAVPAQEMAADFFERTQELCTRAGLPAYEVSNHAKEGDYARHNLLYWRYGDFLGLGPGAHGRVSIAGQRYETVTKKMPQEWLNMIEEQGHAIEQRSVLNKQTQATEMLLMGMRLYSGLSLTQIEMTTGHTIADEVLTSLVEDELINPQSNKHNEKHLVTTPKGMMLLNYLVNQLVDGLELEYSASK